MGTKDGTIIDQKVEETHKLMTRVTAQKQRAEDVIALQLQGWQNWASELEILRSCMEGESLPAIEEQVETLEAMSLIT